MDMGLCRNVKTVIENWRIELRFVCMFVLFLTQTGANPKLALIDDLRSLIYIARSDKFYFHCFEA